jgi:proteasome assembly chaperone (PAC2) family protein
MSLIKYYEQPELRSPVMIIALGGWNDAADAATTAVKFLVDRWTPTRIAEIDGEDFFVFTETRPTIKYTEGIQRTITWPTNQFLAHTDADRDRDIILFVGVEPQLKWKTFSSTFLEICQHFAVSEVVFLGALLADIPHSMVVPVTGASSNTEVMERLQEIDVHISGYEGPTGMLGILQDVCRRAQIPSASLWAAAPHYLAATPNIKVTAALLTRLNAFLALDLDLRELQSDAVRFEEQVTALVARDPEASAYVRKLEEQLASRSNNDDDNDDDEADTGLDRVNSSGPLPSADSLIRGVEELLRKQRQNDSSPPLDDTSEEDR